MAKARLDAVYNASSRDELAQAYDAWAGSYDNDMAEVGYRHPVVGVGLLARYLPPDSAPVLDAGAGTGLIGEVLGTMGYPQVDGLDASPGMLEVARSKGCYRELHHAFLGEALTFDDGRYTAAISTGVFTTGHVGVEGLPELFRVVRDGGIIVLTIKGTLWDSDFEPYLTAADNDGVVRVLEVTPSYASMPAGQVTSPCFGVVLSPTA